MHSDSMARLEERILESVDRLWDNFVDPQEAFLDADGTRWWQIGGAEQASAAAGPAFSNEQEHAGIRTQCRALALGNEFAINGHENRVSYIVGTGHTYRAAVKKGLAGASSSDSVPSDWARQVQTVVDDFIWQNQWHRRQQELVLRRDRDGEAFLRFFVAADGATRVRFVEPGQVATPQEYGQRPECSFGIETDRDDVETVRAYFIDGTPIPAEEIQHRKANVDGNVKRGLPLFYPVRKNLRRAEKLLRNMSVVAEIQSAIALIRKHRGATRTALQQFVGSQADANVTNPATGRTTSFKRFAPGTIIDAQGNVDYDFPAAALNAGSYVTVLQAELRAVASRLVMPEFMLTADASNANYASTMVAEGPAVKMFERLQAQQVADDLEVMWRVVRHAIATGRLPAEVWNAIEIQAQPPSLAVRDVLKEAQVSRIEFESGILSPQTWCQRRGLDYDQEQANLRQHAAERQADIRHRS